MSSSATCGINSPFGELSPTSRQVAHVLLTRSPLDFPSIATRKAPLDLHVLSTPLAFVLSQNQTLHRKFHPLTREMLLAFITGSKEALASLIRHSAQKWFFSIVF